jgi:hypothetical protein
VLAGLVGVVGFASEASAADEPKLPKMSGTVVLVDPTRNVVTLDTGSTSEQIPPQKEFRFDERTVITRAGIRLQPADLQISDDKVAIEYETEGGATIARTITFKEPSGLATASGTVHHFDVLGGALWIQPKGWFAGKEPKAYYFNERSLVTSDGMRTYLANLVPGDEVDIQYVKDGDLMVVYAVSVTPRRGLSPESEQQLSTPRPAPAKPAHVPAAQ